MIFWIAACEAVATEVVMTGTVHDAPFGEGEPVPAATVTILDNEHTESATAETAEDGTYAVTVPAGAGFYVRASADGYVSTGFSGAAGVQDFAVTEGYPWVATAEWSSTARTTYAACEGHADAAGFVIGEARYATAGVAPEVSPPAPSVTVAVSDSTGVERAACYIGEDGVADASLTATTTYGAFAVFGLPAGAMLVSFTQTTTSGDATEVYPADMPEEGIVPMFPALVSSF